MDVEKPGREVPVKLDAVKNILLTEKTGPDQYTNQTNYAGPTNLSEKVAQNQPQLQPSQAEPSYAEPSLPGVSPANKSKPKESASGKKDTKDPLDVVLEIMQRRDGKDKTLKIIQYTGKLLVRLGKSPSLQIVFSKYPIVDTVAPLVAELSMFRKVIKLFDWVKSLRAMQKEDHIDFLDWIDVYTELMDDLYLLAKIGTLRKSAAHSFARQAEFGWYAALVINLYTKITKRAWTSRAGQIDMAKLLCDFAFCTIDVFESNVDALWQTGFGLTSACIAYYKIWKKVT